MCRVTLGGRVGGLAVVEERGGLTVSNGHTNGKRAARTRKFNRRHKNKVASSSKNCYFHIMLVIRKMLTIDFEAQ